MPDGAGRKLRDTPGAHHDPLLRRVRVDKHVVGLQRPTIFVVDAVRGGVRGEATGQAGEPRRQLRLQQTFLLVYGAAVGLQPPAGHLRFRVQVSA